MSVSSSNLMFVYFAILSFPKNSSLYSVFLSSLSSNQLLYWSPVDVVQDVREGMHSVIL